MKNFIVPILALILWLAISNIEAKVYCAEASINNKVKMLGFIKEHSDTAELSMSFVYLSNNGMFSVYDIARPEIPKKMGSIDLKSTATIIRSIGNSVLIASRSGILQSVDVKDPKSPKLQGQCTLRGEPISMTVRNTQAFVGYLNNDKYGFTIVDASVPNNLKVLGRLELPISPGDDRYITINITPSGKTVLMNYCEEYRREPDSKDTLIIVNTANPANPVIVKKIQEKATIVNIVSTDTYAQVECFHSQMTRSDYSVSYYEISDPTNPKRIEYAKVPLNGRGKGGHYYSSETITAKNIMFILDSYEYYGLVVFDTSDIKTPKKIGCYPLDDFNGTGSLWVSDDFILIREILREGHNKDRLVILKLEK